jgi:hypothetical protein
MNSDGTAQTRITTSVGFDGSPDWGPQPPPPGPTSKDDCKNGGWMAFGFKNQGQCIKAVNHQ